MDFAQFVVKRTSIDPELIEVLNEQKEKLGDALITKEIMTKKELIKLLTDYAKQECLHHSKN